MPNEVIDHNQIADYLKAISSQDIEVNYDTPGHNPLYYQRVSWFLSHSGILERSDAQITGTIPIEGPAIVASNHVHTYDLFFAQALPLLTDMAKGADPRTIRYWAKHDLIHPLAKRSKASGQRSSAKDWINQGRLGVILRAPFGALVRQFDVIEVAPDDDSDEAKRLNAQANDISNELLKDGKRVGVFTQGHRRPKGDLLDYKVGVAQLAIQNPDVPVVPLGISGTNGHWLFKPDLEHPVRLNLGQPLCFSDFPELAKLKDVAALRRFMEIFNQRLEPLIEDPSLKVNYQGAKRFFERFGLPFDDSRKLVRGLDGSDLLGEADLLTALFEPGELSLADIKGYLRSDPQDKVDFIQTKKSFRSTQA